MGTLDILLNISNLNKVSDSFRKMKVGEGFMDDIRKAAMKAGEYVHEFVEKKKELFSTNAALLEQGMLEERIGNERILQQDMLNKLERARLNVHEELVKTIKSEVRHAGGLYNKYLDMKQAAKEQHEIWAAKHPLLSQLTDFVAGGIMEKLKSLFQWAAIIGTISLIIGKLNELNDLFDSTGKTAARLASSMGAPFEATRQQIISSAMSIKKAMPLMELNQITPMLNKLAAEGIPAGKSMTKLGLPMTALAYFSGEAAEALVPMIASLVKSKQVIPSLSKALGQINAVFGEFTGAATAAIAKLARFTSGANFNKISSSASAFAGALKNVGLTAEEASGFMARVFDPDFRNMPAIFRPFQTDIRKGNIDALKAPLEELQAIAKSTPDELMFQVAESFQVPPELMMSLKTQPGAVGKFIEDQKKALAKSGGITNQWQQATDSAMNILKSMKESIGAAVTTKLIALEGKIRPVLKMIQRGFSNFLGSAVKVFDNIFGGGGDSTKSMQNFGLFVENLFTSIGKWLEGAFTEKNIAYVKGLFTNLKNWITELPSRFDELSIKIEEWKGKIKGFFYEAMSWAILFGSVLLGAKVIGALGIFKSKASDTGNAIGSIIQNVIGGAIKGLAQGLQALANPTALLGLGAITLALMGLLAVFDSDKGKGFMMMFEGLGTLVRESLGGLGVVIDNVGKAIASVVSSFGGFFRDLATSIGIGVQAFKEFESTKFGGAISDAAASGFGLLTNVLSGITDVINLARGGVQETPASAPSPIAGGVSSSGGLGSALLSQALGSKREAKSNEELLLQDIKAILTATYQVDSRSLEAAIGAADAQKFMAVAAAAGKK